MRFALFKCRFSISLYFVAAVAAMLVIDQTGMAVLALTAICAHEAGHILVMLIFGQMPEEIKLRLGALSIKKPAVISPGSEAAIMAAGPMANILVASICYTLYISVWPKDILLQICIVHAATGLFNLMPLRGLDGGTLFYLLVQRFWGHKAAETATFISSAVFLVTVIVPLAYRSVIGAFNPMIICFAIYLIMLMVMKSHK